MYVLKSLLEPRSSLDFTVTNEEPICHLVSQITEGKLQSVECVHLKNPLPLFSRSTFNQVPLLSCKTAEKL